MAEELLVDRRKHRILGIGSLLLILLGAVPPSALAGEGTAIEVAISEIRTDQSGTDTDEYFELRGTPNGSLSGLTYLVIGDGTAGNGGVIEEVTSLSGTIPTSGFFVVAEATFTLGTANQTADLNFENDQNTTHLVVSGFSGEVGQDFDATDDGELDSIPWSSRYDVVAIIHNPSGDPTYGPPNAGPYGAGLAPAHVMHCDWGWMMGGGPSQAPDSEDTPGETNVCDTDPPSTSIDFPQGGLLDQYRTTVYEAGCSDTTPDVCGTASDVPLGTGLDKVEVRISRGTDGQYWNGTTWQMDEVWNLATGTATWNYPFAPPDEGEYILAARATDLEGNVGSDSAVNFTIDNTPPDTVIDDGPAGTVYTRSAHFEFRGSPVGAHTSECSLDGGAFVPCTHDVSQDYSGLSLGPHEFEVRAIDTAGNVDPSPASRDWVIAAPQPKDVLLSASRKAILKGKRVTLTAQVFPCAGHEGDNVKFQKKVPDGWKTLATKATNASCKAELRPRILKRTTFRAISPKQDDDHRAGTSNTVTVRLKA